MSSIVVDDLKKTFGDNDWVGITCLFCSYKRQNEQRSTDLLASLLKQLVQVREVLPDVVEILYKDHGKRKTRPSFEELSGVLLSVVKPYSRVLIVIDALDECKNSDKGRDRVLRMIFELQTEARISLFATSRFIPEILEEFEGSISLEIRARDDDVKRYVDGHMPTLFCVKRHPEMQEKIKREIIKAVGGMYVRSNPTRVH